MIVLVAALSWTIAASAAASPRPKAALADLAWLEGCWSDGAYEECWNAPAGGAMQAFGRRVKGAETVEREAIEIRAAADGSLTYVALLLDPGLAVKQAATVFALVSASKDRWVFENASHDFPQRIVYERKGDRLNVRIESIDGAKTIDFPLARTRRPR